MKISMKGKYALLLMMDLAGHDAGGPVSLKDIAGRENISEKYLEQVVSMLNKAGLVKSIRGPQGGYHLSKKPEEYKVGDILQVTEGSLKVNSENDEEALVLLWNKIDDAVSSVTDAVTLEELVSWKRENDFIYCI
ncbi:MAG: RrF2 family transcriptional regulator [Lachnospiraceae bacterium]